MVKSKKNYSYINLLIRSSIFFVIALPSLICYSFIVLFSLPFPLSYRFAVIRVFFRFYFYLLENICHIHYKIEGLQNIPKDRVGIIMCKHQSTWETFLLPLIFHNPAIIVKRELLWVPFFGWGLAVSKPISINRNKKSSAMHQIIQQGKKFLEQGRWVLFFPEGTRVPAGTVGQYKLGGARLAVATHAPVLPIAHNAGRYWPRRKFIKYPGTITVVIGPLIESEGHTPESLLALTKDWIESTVLRIDSFVNESTRQ